MKFRKKPVVIEATQWNKPDIQPQLDIKDNLGVYLHQTVGTIGGKGHGSVSFPQIPKYLIDTLEGTHEVTDKDWIITGVKGEKYPCKPDIFALTYEPVEAVVGKINFAPDVTEYLSSVMNISLEEAEKHARIVVDRT